MNKEELWQKIKSFEIDDPQSEFSFTDRLCRENSWSLEYSIRAVMEYKRFIFLICHINEPLTPSDAVDQVWHLHLLYTDSYWNELCKKTIHKKIHHGPTKGGGNERVKYQDLYEKTKMAYRREFGIEPPLDIWPESEIRFGELNFTRVNKDRNWIVKKPKFLLKWN